MKRRKILVYIVFIGIALAVGGVSAVVTMKGMPAFDAAEKPALTPPNIVFPIVWTALYTLMGVGAARVRLAHSPESGDALTVFFVQLILNFFWSVWFFGMQAYLFSFIWLLVLTLAVAVMLYMFYRVDRIAGLLQIPYLIWCCFAAWLNFAVWRLNG